MGLGKVLGQVSGLGLASKVLGGGGLNDIARNGGFGLAGLALAKKKKKPPVPGAPPTAGAPEEEKPMKCGGGVKKMAKGGDVLSTGLKLPEVSKPFSEDTTFVSSPVVQDISKKDRSADDAANARRAARKAPATKARSSSASPKTNLPTGGRGGPKNSPSPKPSVATPSTVSTKANPRGGWAEAARKGPGPMAKKPDYTGPMSKTPKAAPEYKGPMSKSSPTFRTPKAAAPAKKQGEYPIRIDLDKIKKPTPKTDWSAAARKGPSSAMAKPKDEPKYTGPMAKKAKGGVIGFAKGGSIDGCARKGKTRCTKR